jgi:hypothetical protein
MPKSGQPWSAELLDNSALFEDFRELGRPLLQGSGWPTLDAYTTFVEGERVARAPEVDPVCFAPPEPRRRRARGKRQVELADLYDGRVVLRAEVPCLTESRHDFFNVLAWAAFPRSKRALHVRQLRALQRLIGASACRLPNRRSREQDALTLFDEGGSVIAVAGEPFRSVLFGHGLMEHVSFRPAPVGSAAFELYIEDVSLRGRELFDAVDRALARRLSDAPELTPRSFDVTLSVQASDAPHGVSARYVPGPRARHQEQPEGEKADRHEPEQDLSGCRVGDYEQRFAHAAGLARVAFERGAQQPDADDRKDDAARAIADLADAGDPASLFG